MILVIPSIDIKDRKCVRLIQGKPGTETVYSDDPVQMAILWRGENAKMLHVLDLDGALEGPMKNLDVIKNIIQSVEIPIQVSAGVQTFDRAKEIFQIGASRVVMDRRANEDHNLMKDLIGEFGPRKIVVAIDAKNNDGETSGLREDSGLSPVKLGLRMKELGIERALYTDLSRDGTLSSPNFASIKEFAVKSGLKVTASGGIGGYTDLRRMQDLEPIGVDSVVIGRALYENRFPCQELWRACETELKDFGPTRRI